MKIIIAGAGEVGSHLAKMLASENHHLTIVDSDETRLLGVSDNADVVTILGHPTSIAVLQKANVAEADLFVAVYPDKEQDVNIVSAILAKQLGAKKVTARVNNDEYLHHENKFLFTDMGIDLLFYPEKSAAYEICDLLEQAEMSEFVGFAHGKLQFAVIRLELGSQMIDKTSAELLENDELLQFRVVAIARGDETIIPTSETKFRLNDMLYFIARKESMPQLMRYSGKEDINVKRLMILGGGRIGEIVAQKMERNAESIKVIEINKQRCQYLSEKLNKTLVINGDGRNSDLLYEEDCKSCDAFVAVTSSSETNIMACVAAKRLGVPKTIAEVENLEYIKLAEGMGVDAVINKKLITAGRMFRFTLSNKVRTIKCLSGTNAEVLEYLANPDSLITKAPLKDLNFPKEAIIGGIVRGTDSFIATDTTEIKAYDRVAVFALPSALNKVDKFFI